MLEDYIKEIVKNEIAKNNLNKQYGKNSLPIYKVFGDHFNHFIFLTSSNDIRNLLYKLFEDKRSKNCLYFHFFKDDVAMCSISAHKAWNTKFGELVDELEIKSNRFIITKKTGGIDIEKQKLKQENEKLKHENKELKNLSCTIVVGNDGKLDSSFNQKLKSENEKLKKELLDSKNGLNGANHVIKNNKEWINQQDKKIKELEETIRCLKSDKEDLKYNLRRKSTQKIQLETKNKWLEDKFKRIYKTIEENYYQDGYYELLRIKNIILEILKES